MLCDWTIDCCHKLFNGSILITVSGLNFTKRPQSTVHLKLVDHGCTAPEESEALPTPLEICPPGPVHKELKMTLVSTCGMS